MAPTPNLDSLLETATSLLNSLQSTLSDLQQETSSTTPQVPTSTSASPSPPDALTLTLQATTQIRHTATKLTLLHRESPQTPSLCPLITTLLSGPVPALVCAAQRCDPRTYGFRLRRELALLSGRVLSGLQGLLRSFADKHGGGGDGVQATAILWSACDGLERMASDAPAGFFISRARTGPRNPPKTTNPTTKASPPPPQPNL
ncbi:hypothetical protein CDD80_988 [Ophiocordyceps camponoti-rufipedis]|uniref:Cyclin-D1-binding protein 1-like N-terminal domain-containing protein n=1 Tax=Ophiocordyceps camponoti-rufipedis TaxID=2004952 RepID=A0A2C5YG20_9HYPO|nr:hypothetical protein CDD80_988 [Ophiocordyceps camponoti-rufipedis]